MTRASVVSPLVDLLFNMMITMFLFLMVYMAVVLPDRDYRLELLPSSLPRAGYHSEYAASVAVRHGSGDFLFMLAEPGERHELASSESGLVAPEGSDRLDLAGDATFEIDPETGLLQAARVYPDREDQGVRSGSLELPVVVVDRRELARVAPDRLESWGAVKLFFHEEHEGPGEVTEGTELETGHFAVRRSFPIEVQPDSLPFDVSESPLTVMQPAVPAGLSGYPMGFTVPIVGGIEPYEVEIVDAEGSSSAASWLRVEDATTGRITGTPPRAGSWRVIVRVKDGQTPRGDWSAAETQRGNAGHPLGEVTVELDSRDPLASATLELPAYGRVGEEARGRVRVVGGSGQLDFVAMQLPPGLSLTMEGSIVGTPQEEGDFDFAVMVVDLHEKIAEDDAAKRRVAHRAAWRVVPPLAAPLIESGGSR